MIFRFSDFYANNMQFIKRRTYFLIKEARIKLFFTIKPAKKIGFNTGLVDKLLSFTIGR
ncbi:MAG: hypothetical protein Tsb004_08220 [Allomuricauda sp.]